MTEATLCYTSFLSQRRIAYPEAPLVLSLPCTMYKYIELNTQGRQVP